MRSSERGRREGKRLMKRGVLSWFFFSSRRRHTRFDCDWSSDVCSSDLGLKLALSFNLSARQLWQPGALPTLLGKVSAAGVDPGSLIVEIAESTITRDPDRAQRALDQMSAAGLRLAIDDFGTGDLSLARLRNLPVDVLKIDQRFTPKLP